MDGRRGASTEKVVQANGYNPLFDSSSERTPPVVPAPRVPPDAPEAPPPVRGRRALRVLAVVALGLLILVGLGTAGVLITLAQLGDNIPRVSNVFSGLDEGQRPTQIADRVSFLIMGTDSRQATAQRGDDMLMLARVDVVLDPTNTRASVVSFPRDSWVNVPDYGPNTIRSAYGLGGPQLLVRTVEGLTQVRVDHFAIIDFAGFQQMVDAIGGIDLQNSTGGLDHLDGREALAYVSQGGGDPAGYLDRLRHQQNALRGLLDKAVAGGTLTDPAKLIALLDSLSHTMSLDETLGNATLLGLALQMRGLRASTVQFVVSPVQGIGRERGRSVIYLDEGRSGALWNSLRDDTVAAYLQQNPGDSLRPPR
jgi:LCP family protein required for cell wall assembly